MRSSEYVCIRAYDGLTVGGLYNVYNVYYGSRVPSHYGIVNDYNKYRLYSSSLFMCVGDYRDYKIGKILGGGV